MSIAGSINEQTFKALFENTVFLSAITSWFMAQCLKTAIFLLRSKRRSAREALETLTWRTGGMPSSHSALMGSLATAIALKQGFASDLFIVTVFFALVVMRDAMGIRRSSGLQARNLNSLGRAAAEKLSIEYHPVKEIQGHAPIEVIVGALLGIFISAAFTYL